MDKEEIHTIIRDFVEDIEFVIEDDEIESWIESYLDTQKTE